MTGRIIAQLLTALVANENGLSVPSSDLSLKDNNVDGFLNIGMFARFHVDLDDVFGNPLMEQHLSNRSCNLLSIFCSDSTNCPDDGHVSFISMVEI